MIPLDVPITIVVETAIHVGRPKLRLPTSEKACPVIFLSFVFDALPYLDLLLTDLGLRTHRKSGLLAECFEPYGPEDYRGLVDEWKKKARLDEVAGMLSFSTVRTALPDILPG